MLVFLKEVEKNFEGLSSIKSKNFVAFYVEKMAGMFYSTLNTLGMK